MKLLKINRLKIMVIILVIVGLWVLLRSSPVIADEPAAPEAQVSPGQTIYEQRCAPCHGLEGTGDGPAAERLFIKPRDFTRDEYKIKSTSGDEFPSREDLIQVISEGMPGSSMPAWEGVLTQAEIGVVADYVQSFGRFFPQEGYGESLIEIPARVDSTAENLAQGRELYESDIGCLKCHGTAGRGDGPSAFELADNAGNVIYPADLTQPWTFRGGAEPEDIYLRLRTGLTGSPMPSFADALSEEDTWRLVNYILSLSPEEPPEPAVLLASQSIDGPLPADPEDPLWAELPPAYYPLTAQLMRASRYYQPAINAVLVKSVYNSSEVAFYVAWNDRTETREGEAVDALALQFPQELSGGGERPYFVFGDSNRAVYQWYWAADEEAAIERIGNGLNDIKVQPEEQQQTKVTAHYQDGRWQLVFRRSLQARDSQDLAFETGRFIPISFMAWDGAAGEVEGKLGLTSWSVVYLQAPIPTIQYAWVPGVMVVVFVFELVMVWLVRRSVHPSRQE
jgi:DMSO reductase family type II enzyme heme b subunit